MEVGVQPGPCGRRKLMSADQIREALEAATAYLQEHPDEARSTDSAARASLVDGLVVRVTGPGGEGITTDMLPSVGGTARRLRLDGSSAQRKPAAW